MGYSNWSDAAYSKLSGSRKTASRSKIFSNSNVDPTMNPNGLKYRESRDSAAHPDSTAIIVGFDVTGSMGSIPERFARKELGKLMRLLVDNNYIADPQLLFAGIGDAFCDRGPLQVGQFESGLEMDMWLTKIWIEGGGGGQMSESYGLAHYFAANHTSIDCYEKRNKKGYLFTMGDEKSWEVTAEQVEGLFGYRPAKDYSMKELIAEASKMYEVFHIQVADAYHGKDPDVIAFWKDLLGERALVLDKAEGICELIGTTIALFESTLEMNDLSSSLSGMGASKATSKAVMDALVPLSRGVSMPRRARGHLPSTTTADAVERL